MKNTYKYSTVDQPEIVNDPRIFYDNRESPYFDGEGLPKTGSKYQKMVEKLFLEDMFVKRFKYTTVGIVDIVSYHSTNIKEKFLFLENGTCYGDVGKNSSSKNGIHLKTIDTARGEAPNNHVIIETSYEKFEILEKDEQGKVGIMKEGYTHSQIMQAFLTSKKQSDNRNLYASLLYGE